MDDNYTYLVVVRCETERPRSSPSHRPAAETIRRVGLKSSPVAVSTVDGEIHKVF